MNAQQHNNSLDLQSFWVNSPKEWFFMAEASFELAGIVGQRPRFLNVLTALPEHVVRSITDLLRPGAPADLYTQLRRRLLAPHGSTIAAVAKKEPEEVNAGVNALQPARGTCTWQEN